ncbi:MAG: arsenate reductase (glutaredoxin) [Cyclobacteriaceae bacterium]|nr:MAG: arsenate reductase (glutaredoxin) [Cyclobacteriaceae bacterium]
MLTVFHNPRCRKSREALSLLEDANHDIEIREYLKHPPTTAELTLLLKKLGLRPLDLIRTGEKLFRENYKGKDLADSDWIKIMVNNPILIERPIVIKGQKAVIGRPPENILTLLS